MSVNSVQEVEVLRLLRRKKYRRVAVQLENGDIVKAEVEEELPAGDRLPTAKTSPIFSRAKTSRPSR
jgi:hypothetical protein